MTAVASVSRRLILSVPVDLATNRLIKLATALRLAGHVPADSGKALVEMTRSVRLFAEACELASAMAVLDDVDGMVPDGEPEMKPAREALLRATKAVRDRIGFEAKR